MAEKGEIILTVEQKMLFAETLRRLLRNGVNIRFLVADAIIAAAIPDHCTCDTPKYAAGKIGSAYGRGRIKAETVATIAGRHAACRGESKETVVISPGTTDQKTGDIIPQREITVDMCHYASGSSKEAANHRRRPQSSPNLPLAL